MHQNDPMDSQSYLTLNAWLQKSDGNYIDGRLLWLNHRINGSCNLLWLASEQIIKILLLQKDIDTLSLASADLAALHTNLDEKAKKLGHKVHNLIQAVNIAYPELCISKYEAVLKRLQEHFYRRYVVHSGSSIALTMLDEIDELYFLLRNNVHADVGLGTVDEIFIQKKHGWNHPLPAFSFAYLENRHFRPRKHRVVSIQGPDGRIYNEAGE